MPQTDEQGRDMSCPDPRCFICGLEIEADQYPLHVTWHDSLVTAQPGSGKGPIDAAQVAQLHNRVSSLENDKWLMQSQILDLQTKIATLEAHNNVVSMGLSQVEAVIGTEGDFRFVEKTQPPVKVYPLPVNTGSTPYVARSSNG